MAAEACRQALIWTTRKPSPTLMGDNVALDVNVCIYAIREDSADQFEAYLGWVMESLLARKPVGISELSCYRVLFGSSRTIECSYKAKHDYSGASTRAMRFGPLLPRSRCAPGHDIGDLRFPLRRSRGEGQHSARRLPRRARHRVARRGLPPTGRRTISGLRQGFLRLIHGSSASRR